MNIVYIEYSIAQRSLDIFFSGCNNRCDDCCNPELMDFNVGDEWHTYKKDIERYLRDYDSLIDNIFLVGGSPNHQSTKDMLEFLQYIKGLTNKHLWLFAGEELNTVKDIFKEYCDFIKVGAYIPSKRDDNYYQEGIKIATNNQKVLKKGIDY